MISREFRYFFRNSGSVLHIFFNTIIPKFPCKNTLFSLWLVLFLFFIQPCTHGWLLWPCSFSHVFSIHDLLFVIRKYGLAIPKWTFLVTTCMVICVAASNFQWHNSVVLHCCIFMGRYNRHWRLSVQNISSPLLVSLIIIVLFIDVRVRLYNYIAFQVCNCFDPVRKYIYTH